MVLVEVDDEVKTTFATPNCIINGHRDGVVSELHTFKIFNEIKIIAFWHDI